MGKRRIRLIKDMYPDYVIFGIDQRDDRRKEAEKELGIKTAVSMDSVTEKVDCAFVCTSPLSHAAIISECLRRKWHVFTELNLVSDGYEENLKLAKDNGCKLFLSSTFFYREEIKYIRSKITKDKKWNYIYHIGQYLPDWHPWESYKKFFIGKKESNGCREIYAIQLPWLIDTFGDIKNFSAISQKSTNLEIDYDDSYITTLEHKNGAKGVFVVDVVSRMSTTYLEIIGENLHITWNGLNDGLKVYNIAEKKVETFKAYENKIHDDNYAANIFENPYLEEIKDFLNYVENGTEPKWSIQKDYAVLNLIDEIEGV
jgi:predicted dehydrogenase